MKTKITIGFAAFLLLCILPMHVHAAAQCPSNATPTLQAGDPACWTSSSTSGYNTYETKTCTWTCGYPLSICGSGGKQWFCHDTAANCRASTGVSCGSYSSLCYDGCGNGDCQNAGIRTGQSNGTKTIATWHDGSTSYTCHYTTVKTWSACSATTGTRYATVLNYFTTPGTGCTSQNSAQSCGVCGTANGVGTETAPTTGRCAFGTATTPTLSNDIWSWTCRGGDNSTTADDADCSAPRSVDGACNTTTEGSYNWYDTAFRGSLCTTGTPTINQNTDFPAYGATVTWGCNGIGTGTSTAQNACTATRAINPACVCGSADKSTSLNAPSSNLCTIGNASPVAGSNGTWSWTCGTPYTYNTVLHQCTDQKPCTAECVDVDLDMPTQIYVTDGENKVNAHITISNCSAANDIDCNITVGGTNYPVPFAGTSCTSDTVYIPFAGPSMTAIATCDMHVTCGGGGGSDEKHIEKPFTIQGMCAERSCTNQGTCQAVPKSAASPSDCHSTCSTDADCSRGRMIETRP